MVSVRWVLGLGLGVALALYSSGSVADDKVYQRKDREGRTVYTNVDNVTVDGRPLAEVPLPALARLDLRSVPAPELSKLDRRVEDAHQSTQAGEQCGAIRAASRVPLRTWLWSDHQRELFTAAALFVFSLVVGFAWSGRVMRTLMPIAPFAGSVFLLYVATTRSQEAMDDLHSGLRACSTDLPDARPSDPAAVKSRLDQALDQQAKIDQIFSEREAMIERSLAGH